MNILVAGLKAKHIQVALQANLSLWLYLMIKAIMQADDPPYFLSIFLNFQEADIACVT